MSRLPSSSPVAGGAVGLWGLLCCSPRLVEGDEHPEFVNPESPQNPSGDSDHSLGYAQESQGCARGLRGQPGGRPRGSLGLENTSRTLGNTPTPTNPHQKAPVRSKTCLGCEELHPDLDQAFSQVQEVRTLNCKANLVGAWLGMLGCSSAGSGDLETIRN